MLERLLSLDYRRRRLLKGCPPGALHDLLSAPFPDPTKDCRATPYLALDLETSGLDPSRDAILSIGSVALQGVRVDLASAQHLLVRTDRPLAEESVLIHQLTDDALAAGLALEDALARTLHALCGRVLIAHHAEVEVGFLNAACQRVFGCGLVVPVVDTQWIARRTLERRNQPYGGSAMRLFNLREGYNLPRYNAHNALSDALAAAELFTAQIAERGDGRLPLGDYMRRI